MLHQFPESALKLLRPKDEPASSDAPPIKNSSV